MFFRDATLATLGWDNDFVRRCAIIGKDADNSAIRVDAFLTHEIDLNFQANIGGAFESGFSWWQGDGLWDTVGTYALNTNNLVPQVDIARKMMYKGSSPFNLNLRLIIVPEISVDEFVIPFINLCRIILPTRGAETLTALYNLVTEGQNYFRDNEFLVAAGNIVKKGIDWLQTQVNKNLGEIYLLKPPTAITNPVNVYIGYSAGDTNYDGTKAILPYTFRDMLITSVSFHFGDLIMEYGLPSHCEIEVSLTSNRVTTTDAIQDILHWMPNTVIVPDTLEPAAIPDPTIGGVPPAVANPTFNIADDIATVDTSAADAALLNKMTGADFDPSTALDVGESVDSPINTDSIDYDWENPDASFNT